MTAVDLDLERAYLGAVIVDPQVWHDHPLPLDVIWSPAHRSVLEAAGRLIAAGEQISKAALDVELGRLGHDQYRNEDWLRLARYEPSPGTVASRLRELAQLRRLSELGKRLTVAADKRAPFAELQDLATEISDEVDRGHDGIRIDTAEEVMAAGVARLVELAERGACDVVTTGNPDWDEILVGYQRGDVATIGADSGVGKSTTQILCALHQAFSGHRVGIISFEDGKVRYFNRIVSTLGGVPMARLLRNQLSRAHWDRVGEVSLRVGSSEIVFSFPCGGSKSDLRAAMRSMIDRHGITACHIDYLTAIMGKGGGESMRDHIREVMAIVRAESNRPGKEVVSTIGSQVRKIDGGRPPELEDLYEANDIRQKSDTIVLLHKEVDGKRTYRLAKTKDVGETDWRPLYRGGPDRLFVSESQYVSEMEGQYRG